MVCSWWAAGADFVWCGVAVRHELRGCLVAVAVVGMAVPNTRSSHFAAPLPMAHSSRRAWATHGAQQTLVEGTVVWQRMRGVAWRL
jgi:hypothetical protein